MSSSQDHGWVALAGAGPGDEGLLTVRAAELLGQADVVVAGADLAPVARRHMRRDAHLADPADGAGSARTLVQAANDGQLAVRLFYGDPMLNGAVHDAAACAKAGVRFEIVPGLPAATAVPAYAAVSAAGGSARGVVPPGSSAQLRLQAAVMSTDGSRVLRAHGGAPGAEARRLGRDLAAELLRSGASDLISVPQGTDEQRE